MNKSVYISLLALTLYGTTFSGKTAHNKKSEIIELRETPKNLIYSNLPLPSSQSTCRKNNDYELNCPSDWDCPTDDDHRLIYPTDKTLTILGKNGRLFIAKITYPKKKKGVDKYFQFFDAQGAKQIAKKTQNTVGTKITWYFADKNYTKELLNNLGMWR